MTQRLCHLNMICDLLDKCFRLSLSNISLGKIKKTDLDLGFWPCKLKFNITFVLERSDTPAKFERNCFLTFRAYGHTNMTKKILRVWVRNRHTNLIWTSISKYTAQHHIVVWTWTTYQPVHLFHYLTHRHQLVLIIFILFVSLLHNHNTNNDTKMPIKCWDNRHQ